MLFGGDLKFVAAAMWSMEGVESRTGGATSRILALLLTLSPRGIQFFGDHSPCWASHHSSHHSLAPCARAAIPTQEEG